MTGMTGTIRNTTVEGTQYKVWSDFMDRCTYAENENGEIKKIRSNGYISNDLSIRKAIAIVFGHNSFRKSI